MRLLVFQHSQYEHPGSLRRLLARDQIDWHAVNLDVGEPIPDLHAFDALWVMGGAMDVWDVEAHPWLIEEKKVIRHWVTKLQKPYLGVCLGHQLLADALGGTCGPLNPPEVGIYNLQLSEDGKSDPIFDGIPAQTKCSQWHYVQVAQAPEGATILAKSSKCPNQAMRIGKNAWSIQFHLEHETSTLQSWAKIPDYQEALLQAVGSEGYVRLVSDFQTHSPTLLSNAEKMYGNFLAHCSCS